MNDELQQGLREERAESGRDFRRRIDRERDELFRGRLELACWAGAVLIPAYVPLDLFVCWGKLATSQLVAIVVIRIAVAVALASLGWLLKRRIVDWRTIYKADTYGFTGVGLAIAYIISATWSLVPDYYVGLGQIMMARCVLFPGGPRRALPTTIGMVLALPVGLYVFRGFDAQIFMGLGLQRLTTAVAGLLGFLAVGIIGSFLYDRLMSRELKSRQLERYRFDGVIDQGGGGVVHRAWDQTLGRPCAIKVIPVEKVKGSDKVRERFELEAQKTSLLKHAHVIEIYDYGETLDGDLFYAMEFLDGMDILSMVKRAGPIAPDRVIHISKQVCSALGGAHKVGLIHRDIKPANLFVTHQEDNPDFVKVLDFGLVKVVARSRFAEQDLLRRIREAESSGEWWKELSQIQESHTDAASFQGTPAYAAPEQIERAVADERSDIYGLGGVMYFMLTGTRPFNEQNQYALVFRKLKEEPVRPTDRRPNLAIPYDLESVVMRCMARDPQRRFQTMADVREALDDCAHAGDWDAKTSQEFWTTLPEGYAFESIVDSFDPDETVEPGAGGRATQEDETEER